MQPARGVGGLRGWRRTVARVLAYWNLVALMAAIVLAISLYVWLFTTTPAEKYWQCMDGRLNWMKETGLPDDLAFRLADDACGRPGSLSGDDALTEWQHRWDQA